MWKRLQNVYSQIKQNRLKPLGQPIWQPPPLYCTPVTTPFSSQVGNLVFIHPGTRTSSLCRSCYQFRLIFILDWYSHTSVCTPRGGIVKGEIWGERKENEGGKENEGCCNGRWNLHSPTPDVDSTIWWYRRYLPPDLTQLAGNDGRGLGESCDRDYVCCELTVFSCRGCKE